MEVVQGGEFFTYLQVCLCCRGGTGLGSVMVGCGARCHP